MTGGVCDLCPVFLVRLDIHRSSYGFLRINFYEMGDFLEDVEEIRRNYKVCFEKKGLRRFFQKTLRVFCFVVFTRVPAKGRLGLPSGLLVHHRQGQLPQAGGLPEGRGAGP